ncbi:P-loop containing nucleoside triphosphate hydrolase protein [Amylostereum chailletii]|nr:P-loop containing nucleoside triphosphate hydrolase protein [Amylostereum chailletii]
MSLPPDQITLSLPILRELIDKWHTSQGIATASDETTASHSALEGVDFRQAARENKDVVVAFRSRPFLPEDAARFGGDSASDPSTSTSATDALCVGVSVVESEPGKTVVHFPNKKWNGLTVAHKMFESDVAFGPTSTNEHLYQTTVKKHDMVSLVLGGGVACILAYGQTGTGKTFTTTALQRNIASEFFQQSNGAGYEIFVSCVELIGKAAYDLAWDSGDKPSVSVSEDKASPHYIIRNEVQTYCPVFQLGAIVTKATVTQVRTAAALDDLMTRCLSYRRTSATARNSASSRSHAIMHIRVKNPKTPTLDAGEFILVDLAGSERYEDNKAHSQQLMDESKENNKSLLALKECVRARARAESDEGFVHIPYRTSRLTLLLKPIFDIESARLTKTLVIAHVSPHIQDSSHSINTLSYAAPFRITPPRRPPMAYDPEDPRTWDHASSIKWLTTAFAQERATRRLRGWERQDADARLQNKRVRPLSPLPEDAPLLLDLDALCPSPHGGPYLGRMYSAEWMDTCVASIRPGEHEPDIVIDTLKSDAESAYLALCVLLMRAKTRTRTAIMKSRAPKEPLENEPLHHLHDLYAIVNSFSPDELTAFTPFQKEAYDGMIRRFEGGMSMDNAARESFVEVIEKFKPIRQAMAEEQKRKDFLEANWPGEWVDYIETEL